MLIENGAREAIIGLLAWEAIEKAFGRTARNGYRRVLFGLERKDLPGSTEDVVDIIAKYDARLISLLSRKSDSSERVCIYVNASEMKLGNVPELREELGGLGEILYFKSVD